MHNSLSSYDCQVNLVQLDPLHVWSIRRIAQCKSAIICTLITPPVLLHALFSSDCFSEALLARPSLGSEPLDPTSLDGWMQLRISTSKPPREPRHGQARTLFPVNVARIPFDPPWKLPRTEWPRPPRCWIGRQTSPQVGLPGPDRQVF